MIWNRKLLVTNGCEKSNNGNAGSFNDVNDKLKWNNGGNNNACNNSDNKNAVSSSSNEGHSNCNLGLGKRIN